MNALEVVSVTGRWATLSNGDHVTSIPAFCDLGYDAQLFEERIIEFHQAPAQVLNRDGIVDRVSAWRKKGESA